VKKGRHISFKNWQCDFELRNEPKGIKLPVLLHLLHRSLHIRKTIQYSSDTMFTLL